MEGRHPPPRATHPFPDNPNMKVFWSNPKYIWGYLKVSAAVSGLLFSLFGFQWYFMKDSPYVYGQKIKSKEEYLARKKMIHRASELQRKQPMDANFRIHKLFPDGLSFKEAIDRGLEFDDGVEFRPIHTPDTLIFDTAPGPPQPDKE